MTLGSTLDSGTKARFYHAVKAAHMAHVIKVDLKEELFSYAIDEEKKRYLELLGWQVAAGDQHQSNSG